MKNMGEKCVYVCATDQEEMWRRETVCSVQLQTFECAMHLQEAKLWKVAHCQYKLFWYKNEFSMCQHNQL